MNERMEFITALKGIGACIIAFFWHYQHFAGPNISPFKGVFTLSYTNGWVMVELFFMLSGFGMMLGYGNRLLSRSITFTDYIMRRLKKLYPIFIFTTLIVIFINAIHIYKYGKTFVYPNYDLYHFVINLIFMQNGPFGTEWSLNSPSWCISITIICYILFFYLCYTSKNSIEFFYKSVIISLLSIPLVLLNFQFPIFNSLIGRGFLSFFIGVILCHIYKSKIFLIINKNNIGYALLVFLITSYLICRYFPQFIGNFQFLFILGIGPTLILLPLLLKYVKTIIEFRLFLFLGSISLEIYLFHYPVQCFFHTAFGNQFNYGSHVFYLCYVLSVITVSFLYQKFINMHFINLCKKLFITSHKISDSFVKNE